MTYVSWKKVYSYRYISKGIISWTLELDISKLHALPLKFVQNFCIYIHDNYESHVVSLAIA